MKTHQFAEMELAGLQNQTVHTASIKALSSISLHTSLLLQLPAGEFASLEFTNQNCQCSHDADRRQNLEVLLTQFEEM